MKNNRFFQTEDLKKRQATGLVLAGALVIFSLGFLVHAYFNARGSARAIKESQLAPVNENARALWKEKLWLENQWKVSREDSMNLSIDLKDSMVRLQFKGLTLAGSRIRQIRPVLFLQQLPASAYEKIFGSPSVILSEQASLVKKPFHKVSASQAGDTTAFLKPPRTSEFTWHFRTDHRIQVVIFGCDTLVSRLHPAKDILRFRLQQLLARPDQAYFPTLFLWIGNKEATDMYRALPEKGKVIFRN